MKFVSHSFVLENSLMHLMFLSYSFSTLNEYYILFSILFYPKFCQPRIISEQNSKRVSKDRIRKQLLHMLHMKSPYTRYGYELESADAVLSRIRYLRRERLVTRSCIQMKLTFISATPFRNADKTTLLDYGYLFLWGIIEY